MLENLLLTYVEWADGRAKRRAAWESQDLQEREMGTAAWRQKMESECRRLGCLPETYARITHPLDFQVRGAAAVELHRVQVKERFRKDQLRIDVAECVTTQLLQMQAAGLPTVGQEEVLFAQEMTRRGEDGS